MKREIAQFNNSVAAANLQQSHSITHFEYDSLSYLRKDQNKSLLTKIPHRKYLNKELMPY